MQTWWLWIWPAVRDDARFLHFHLHQKCTFTFFNFTLETLTCVSAVSGHKTHGLEKKKIAVIIRRPCCVRGGAMIVGAGLWYQGRGCDSGGKAVIPGAGLWRWGRGFTAAGGSLVCRCWRSAPSSSWRWRTGTAPGHHHHLHPAWENCSPFSQPKTRPWISARRVPDPRARTGPQRRWAASRTGTSRTGCSSHPTF